MKPEIKERIQKMQKGEVPEGYKKSKVGIVPMDWDCAKAKNLFVNHTNKHHNGDLTVLSVTQDRGIIPRSEVDIDIKYSPSNLGSYKKVEKGDFVISLRSFEGGIEFSELEGLVSPAYTVLKKKEELCIGYFREYFKTKNFISKLNSAIYGIRDGKQIGYDDFGNLHIHIPPLSEQKLIAEILSLWDKALRLKEQLIAKKKQQKEWLSENLLTGRKRLPGFSGKWEETPLGEVCEVVSGGTPDTFNKSYWGGEIPWCTPKDITSSKKYIYKTKHYITEEGLKHSSATILPVGSVLMCSRATIGPRAIAMTPIATNQGFKSFICSDAIFNEFLYYYIDLLLPLFIRKANGSTFYELSKSDTKSTKIKLPSFKEQTAIAEVLSTADREIELHERHLEELKKQKTALMQLLLTGIVRANGQEVCW